MMRIFILIAAITSIVLTATADRRGLFSQDDSGSASYDPASDSTAVQWLKADNSTVVGAHSDGDAVSTWTANAGKSATAAGGVRPLYQTAVKNGLPAIEFDGTDDRMTTASFDAAVTQPCAVACVVQYTGNTYDSRVAWCGSGDRTDLSHQATGDVMAIYAGNGADNRTIGTSGAGWHLYIITFNGASSSAMVDGGSDTTVAASPGTAGFNAGLALGSLEVAAQFWQGHIGEVIIFNAVPDATKKGQIRDYLNTRWAIY